MTRNPVSVLRFVGLLETFSFVLLVFVAVPLKYAADEPGPVRFVGMAHGVLFLTFCGALLWTWFAARWPVKRVGIAFLASLLPLGPLVIDKRVVRWADEYAGGDVAGDPGFDVLPGAAEKPSDPL